MILKFYVTSMEPQELIEEHKFCSSIVDALKHQVSHVCPLT